MDIASIVISGKLSSLTILSTWRSFISLREGKNVMIKKNHLMEFRIHVLFDSWMPKNCKQGASELYTFVDLCKPKDYTLLNYQQSVKKGKREDEGRRLS